VETPSFRSNGARIAGAISVPLFIGLIGAVWPISKFGASRKQKITLGRLLIPLEEEADFITPGLPYTIVFSFRLLELTNFEILELNSLRISTDFLSGFPVCPQVILQVLKS